mgnify:CR=1 FL=1
MGGVPIYKLTKLMPGTGNAFLLRLRRILAVQVKAIFAAEGGGKAFFR